MTSYSIAMDRSATSRELADQERIIKAQHGSWPKTGTLQLEKKRKKKNEESTGLRESKEY